MKYTNQNQELLTEEVQEIISYRPHWIVRKGNTIFMVIVLLLLSLTWVIRYPDKVNATTKLTALNPPKLIIAKLNGKVLKLFVTNEQQVKKGQHLAYLESTGDYKEVLQVQNWIEEAVNALLSNDINMMLKRPFPRSPELGELQVACQVFENELEITRQTLASGYYQKKKGALQKDLDYLATLKSNAMNQKSLVQQNQQLDQREYDAYEKLAHEKVIAPLELNQYKSKLLAKEQSLEQVNAQMTNTDINSHGKRKELLDLDKQIADQQQQFYSSLLALKSQVEIWIQQYIITAPEDGKLVYASSLEENELVTNGQSLFYVQPATTTYYAELMAGQQGFGKIKNGQKVIIKVESYLASEFGYLEGIVSYISSISNRNDSFLVRTELKRGLVTNYGKTLFFRNGLTATAEIITEDRRLFDRLVGRLKTLLN